MRMESTVEALCRSIAGRRDDMATFLSELVRVRNENPPGLDYEAGLKAVSRGLRNLGLESRIEPVPAAQAIDHPRFWLSSDWGEGAKAVYFHGHIDVVPAQDPSQFEPRVTEDTIFGRGSTDMKGGLVSMIYAIRALEDTGLRPKGRIALRVVPDEETGGLLGSRALCDRGLLFGEDACAMLTAEPTGGVVWNASRGALTYRLRVRGRTSHVGLSYRGANAFEKSFPLLQALAEIKKDVESRSTEFPLEPEGARRSILMMGGEVRGEQNFNVVPESFSFTVDRRLNPEEDFDEEKRRLLAAFETARAQGVELEVECIQEARPASADPEHAAAHAVAKSVEDVTGARPRLELCPGILEIRFTLRREFPRSPTVRGCSRSPMGRTSS